jgi:hypothetical protein
MTIKQALKLKNKLVHELNELLARLHKNNSVIEGNQRDYSTKETLAVIYTKVDELTALKTQIHQANSVVYDKIFLLSELKSVVKNLKALDCTNGISEDYYSRRNETATVKTSEITAVERDNEVKFLESRIEELQDELDYHNSVTHLEPYEDQIVE